MPIPISDAAALARPATAWLLTYLLHSTLLLGAVWLLSSRLGARTLPIQEAIWRVALVGGLVTASLQLGLGLEPAVGGWKLPASPSSVLSSFPGSQGSEIGPALAAAIETRPTEASLEPVAAGSRKPESLRREFWALGLTALWLAGGLLLTAGLALSQLRLLRRLRGRREVTRGPLPTMLRRLRPRAPVRLSASGRISVPLALGLRRPEICLPERALSELPVEHQEIVLAHELAHLERRDPLWQLGWHLTESLLFLQPLNRLARRRLQEIAEYRCDDWAVNRTGRPVGLARCLTEVAEWSVRGGAPALQPSMAAGRSGLGRRVARLLDRAYPMPTIEPPRWLRPLAVGLLVVIALVAPGVSRGGHGAAADEPAAAPAEAALPQDAEMPTSPDAETPALQNAETPPPPPSPGQPEPVHPAAAPRPPSPAETPASEAPTAPAAVPLPPPTLAATARIEELAAAIASKFRPDPEAIARLERLAAEVASAWQPDPAVIARIEELSARIAAQSEPDSEALARVQAMAERIEAEGRPDPQELERLEALAREVTRRSLPDPEAIAELRELTRSLTEAVRPEAAELERLRREAGEIAAAARLSEAERERLREEMLRLKVELQIELEQHRELIRRELERLREPPPRLLDDLPPPAPDREPR